jgi:hypothetical protein
VDVFANLLIPTRLYWCANHLLEIRLPQPDDYQHNVLSNDVPRIYVFHVVAPGPFYLTLIVTLILVLPYYYALFMRVLPLTLFTRFYARYWVENAGKPGIFWKLVEICNWFTFLAISVENTWFLGLWVCLCDFLGGLDFVIVNFVDRMIAGLHHATVLCGDDRA